ncbi:MAG: ammonium transporter [Verrucomicrobiota bacterium]|nr:ammonium transporter [Verrucomicrobiota bacterium]
MKAWTKMGLSVLGLATLPAAAWCADAAGGPLTQEAVEKLIADGVQHNLDVVWTLVAGILVFFMQTGFALVEAGLTRAKNAANIMMKNFFDFALGSIAFYMVGSALMFGNSDATHGLIGTDGFFMTALLGNGGEWNWTFFFFQTMFAATAATIVSGAMAERTKFKAYLIYSFLVSLVIYPIAGKWAWGGGWLSTLATPFCDFAGSTVVHSVGGWLALAGAIVLGPRIGKYGLDGKPRIIPGHNLVLATVGVFVLWVGWFGFNPGSTVAGVADVGRIALVTNLGAVAGAVTAMFTAWIVLGKPDLSMSLNGCLAGLVAITAPCNTVTMVGALIIGAVAGVLVVLSVLFFDKIHVDDPVGAVSVHCANGVWGTLACGLFNAEKVLGTGDASTGLLYGGGSAQLVTQVIGILSYGVWAFGLGLLLFYGIKVTIGLRVSAEDELKGLDITEHGNEAYAGFQIFSNQ